MATVAGDVSTVVVDVVLIVAVVAWHWINRRYPRRWD